MSMEWDDGVAIGIAALAGILFAIALRGYLHTRTTRVLLFTCAFGVLFVKGLLKFGEVLGGNEVLFDALELVAEASVLLLFFFGMVKQ